jgi:hypothetical protein
MDRRVKETNGERGIELVLSDVTDVPAAQAKADVATSSNELEAA